MDIAKALQDAWGIVKLDEKAMDKVSKQKDAWIAGLIIVVVAGILGTLSLFSAPSMMFGQRMMRPSGAIMLSTPVGVIIWIYLWVLIVFVMSRILGGKASYMQLFQPLAYAELLSWVAVLNPIPYAGSLANFLAGVWSIIVTIVVIKTVNKFGIGKAIAVVFVPILVLLVLMLLAILILGVAFFSSLRGMMGVI